MANVARRTHLRHSRALPISKVFKLCAPVGGKHPLAAGTHGISNTGFRKRPRGHQGGERRIIDGLNDRGVGPGSAIGQAACCIQQKARNDQNTHTSAQRSKGGQTVRGRRAAAQGLSHFYRYHCKFAGMSPRATSFEQLAGAFKGNV